MWTIITSKIFHCLYGIDLIFIFKKIFFRIQSFQRKHDVLAVLIIFDSRGTENSGSGYRHPGREADMPPSFPVVVCCPNVSNKFILNFSL